MAFDKTIDILLVDDDDVDVMTVQRVFKKNQITNPLYVASNGIEALAWVRSDRSVNLVPSARQLILLDLNMPRMNGIEFLRELRSEPEGGSIPVIVLTTSNEEKDKVDAYKLNVAGYILKPFTFSKLVDVMSTTLNNYWTREEIN